MRSDLLASCREFPIQEAHRLWNTSDIIEMGCQNSQCSCANSITGVANNQNLGPWEVWDLSTVLKILGISISDNTNDLIFDAAR